MSTDATTLGERANDSLHEPVTQPVDVAALTVVWSRDRPERVGEVFLLGRAGPLILGRMTRLGASDPRRLRPVWQRPGENRPRPPLSSERISREQLLLEPGADGPGAGVAVVNRGRLPLRVNDHPVPRALVRPGDRLALGDELVLLCQRRPQRLPASEGALHPFGRPDADGIVGEGPAAWALRRAIGRAARRGAVSPPDGRRAHALILGESGVGKELAAGALHRRAGRGGALVARSAATFPEGLIDAELFGNIRSYPNPGTPARPGLIGRADGGTLFLDEIGELPQALQARLLRVLDAGEYHRLGEASARRADLLFVGASNRPEASIKHDLLARMSQRIQIPGLNERLEDVPLLANWLLEAAGAEVDRFRRDDGALRLAPALIEALLSHRYTAHARELRRLLWVAIDHSEGRYLDGTDALPLQQVGAAPPGTADPRALTREQVIEALTACDFVQARAWRRLGLSSRHQLSRLMKKFDVQVP